MKRIVELKEEEDEQDGEEEADDHYDDSHDEVFSLELARGERGLGLALVDTRVSERDAILYNTMQRDSVVTHWPLSQDTSLTVKGIFIRAVLPDSPAALCEKLVPGDRILAVNGVSLLGLDYQRYE